MRDKTNPEVCTEMNEKCQVCKEEKGHHTYECYYEMYILSGKEDYKEIFEKK